MSSLGAGAFPHHGRFSAASMLAAYGASSALGSAISLFVFGQAVLSAAGTMEGEATALMTARIDAWRFGQDGYTLASAGGTRAAVMFPAQDEDNTAIRIVIEDIDDKIACMVRARLDGRNGYAGGLLRGVDFDPASFYTTSSKWYAVIWRVQESKPIDDDSSGNTVYAVPAGASDTPSSGFCFVDVDSRVATGRRTTLDFRVVDGVLELRLDDESTPTVRHNTDVTYTPEADVAGFGTSATGSFEDFLAVGFASAVDGARVVSASAYSLEGQTGTQADALVVACAGDIWACVDGSNLVRAAAGGVDDSADVSMVDYSGLVLMLDGRRAHEFDPVTLLLTDWTLTDGTFPGQTTAGTCTARGLGKHGTRVVLFDIPGEESNAYLSAVGDHEDLQTGSELQGHAFTIMGTRPLKLGHPIVAWQESTNSISIVGCDGSVQAVLGDPALGNFDTATLEEQVGISGQRSMTRLQDGLVVGHGPEGLMAIPVSGEAVNFSRETLTAILNKSRAELEDLSILVARDPKRSWVHVFLTPDDGSAGRHVIYDERTGGLRRGAGGFYEQSYPADQQPTCATIWQGDLVLGCRDGYLRRFDDAVYADDGTAFEASFMRLLPVQGVGMDIEVRNIAIQTSTASAAVTVRALGALRDEDLMSTTRRRVLLARSRGPNRQEPLPFAVRHRAVAVQVMLTSATGTFSVEEMQADVAAVALRRG